MLKQEEQTFVLTPFIVAHEEQPVRRAAETSKVRRPGAHLEKEDATREVLNRIVKRVKKI